MLSTILSLVARLAAIRWAFKTLLGLGVLVPVAFILKVVGLPILAVLSVLALPVLFVLFLFGLPIFMVLIVGAVLMAGVFFMLTLGMLALKIFLFVVLPIWLIWKIGCWLFQLVRHRRETVVAS
jgi:hypothetical protein